MQASRHSSIGFALAALYVQQFASTSVSAQTPPAPTPYDPRLTFAPLTLPDPVNAYRSGDGSPGAELLAECRRTMSCTRIEYRREAVEDSRDDHLYKQQSGHTAPVFGYNSSRTVTGKIRGRD